MLNRSHRFLLLSSLLLLLALVYVLTYPSTEPFFNNDETRHLMTGVYFRDLLRDLPLGHLRQYTVNYYLQYPALGLLVWPPFFYFLEGLAMSLFGISPVVPKVLVGLFGALACVYLFLLVCRSHDQTRAAVAVLFFGLAPLVYEFSHYVMMEVPTLALSLAATYHFISYLDEERRRDLLLSALFAALAALTRFDAVYLLPLFLILIVAHGRRLHILWRRDVLVSAALALLLVAPFYALSASQIGWLHFKSATETLSPAQPGFLSFSRFIFYPSQLPAQFGLVPLIPALVGLLSALTPTQRKTSWPYLSIVAATYLTFTPIGELDSRHTIYWLPAFAFFAATGLALIAGWLRAPQFYLPLAACVLAAGAWMTFARPLRFVLGYEDAARYVVANSGASPYYFFVGGLNGNFIYQLRRLDTDRRRWVLRADKMLFSLLEVPGIQFRQIALSEEEILATIYRYDPEFIVMEEPLAAGYEPTAMEEKLRREFENRVRAAINNHPERFNLEKVIPVTSNEPLYRGMTLKVFRNTFRNQNPERRLDVEILMLRRSLQTSVP